MSKGENEKEDIILLLSMACILKKKLKKHPFKIEQELKICHSELGLYKLK